MFGEELWSETGMQDVYIGIDWWSAGNRGGMLGIQWIHLLDSKANCIREVVLLQLLLDESGSSC